jgi:recombination protein RecT
MNVPVTQQAMVAAQPTMRDLAAMPLDQAISANSQQFANALPSHMKVTKFTRVVMTAISSNPDLAKADRRSLFNSAVKAAQDGLLPDGREGAFVIYNTSVKVGQGKDARWDKIATVQWQRMVAGIRKLIRNSGQIADLWAEVVYEADVFRYRLGLNRDLVHEPAFQKPLKERGKIIAAYSVAKFKDGGTSFDVMSIDEIMDVWRKSSKQKDKDGNATGMWKEWPTEAYKKTVVKRHSKQLPMSTDQEEVFRDDEDAFDIKTQMQAEALAPRRPQISDFAQPTQDENVTEIINEDGEILEETQSPATAAQGDAKPEGEAVATSDPSGDAPDEIYNNGWFAFADGAPLMAPPDGYTADEITRWKTGWQDAEKDKKSRTKA